MLASRPGHFAAAVVLAALAACSSYDAPPLEPEVPTTKSEISGFVTNGSFGFGNQPFSLKSLYGYGPTGTTDSLGRFTIGTQDLEPPFVIEAGSFYAVSPDSVHTINVTPFTTMQVMVLGGNDPSSWFNNTVQPSGRDGVPDLVRMTPMGVAAAQSSVIEVMKEDAGFIYEPDTMSFVATQFKANGTDPMSVMLNNFNNAYGDPSAFAPLLIPEGKRCRPERVYVVTGPRTRQFCPALKSNEPDPGDASVTVYGATNSRSDSLQVRVRSNALTGITYTRHDEEAAYTCSGSACTGVTLGAINGEGKRPITFDATVVSQAGGLSARLYGSMLANDPGPPRPPQIECAEGLIRVTANFEDGNLRQGCQYPGFFGTYVYGGINSAQLDPSNDDGGSYSVVVRSKDNQVLSVAMQDPNGGALYYCRVPACGDVSVTAPASDGAYEITLTAATLAGVNQDGTPSGMPGATITASAPLQAFAGFDPGPPCMTDFAPYDTLKVTLDEGGTVPLCVGNLAAEDHGVQAYSFGGPDTNYVGICVFSNCFTVVSSNAVVSMLFVSFSFGDNWAGDDPAFAGVTTTGPDGDGLLGLEFQNARIRDIEAFGIPGVRTGTLNGSIDQIPFLNFSVQNSRLRGRLMAAVKLGKTRWAPPPNKGRPPGAATRSKPASRGGRH